MSLLLPSRASTAPAWPPDCRHGRSRAGTERYTIQSWWVTGPGAIGLIVADEAGTAFLVSGGRLQLRCDGPSAADRLARVIARSATNIPPPLMGSCSLQELSRLVEDAGRLVAPELRRR